MRKILIINGPNLNMLGLRQPDIYGEETLADIEEICINTGAEIGVEIDFRQSNDEGEIVSWIQNAGSNFDGIVINAAAYSHSSVAILDALLIFNAPVIEVHLSNIFKRETFRHHSYVSQAATGCICGLGSNGYSLAIKALASQQLLNKE